MPKQKAKPVEEQPQVEINYTILPWFAVEADDPKLSGIRGIGKTPLAALTNLRGELLRQYPIGQYRLIERIANPEFAKGWRMPDPDGL